MEHDLSQVEPWNVPSHNLSPLFKDTQCIVKNFLSLNAYSTTLATVSDFVNIKKGIVIALTTSDVK